MSKSTFYFDLGSPYAYLSAERIDGDFEDAGLEPPVWRPVLLGGLFKRFGRSSWALTESRDEGMAEIERRAADYGLPPVRWPHPWPDSYLLSMRVATAAALEDRTREFALAAFRQAFVLGRDLANRETLRLAAADCGLDPDQLMIASGDVNVKMSLRANTEMAGDRGVTGVPTVAIGETLFWGDDQLDAAVEFAVGWRGQP